MTTVTRRGTKRNFLLFSFLLLNTLVFSQKTLFTPTEWSNPNNEFYQKVSDARRYESANFVVYWGDKVGTDPSTYTDPSTGKTDLRFKPQSVADTLEYSFKRYITDLKFCNNAPTTNLGKYKIIVMMMGTWNSTDTRLNDVFAQASSFSNIIAAMFCHPSATKDGGALSHEFAHCLQFMQQIQENPGNQTAFAGYDWAGFFYETHANFMRGQAYPQWAEIDGTLSRWIQTRQFTWSSMRHHYTCFHLLYYVQEKDGFDFTRRMWAESKYQEHPLQTIKRLKGFTQEQFNDYLWGYAQRQPAFDYPIQWDGTINPTNNFGVTIRKAYQSIKATMPRYTSRQYTILTQVAGTTDQFYPNTDWAPQDYGMNIIPLYPTCTGTQKNVSVKFKGHTEVNTTYAGWRYGFVTTKADGTISRYGAMQSGADAEVSFTFDASTEANLYLVVFSAPKDHYNYNMDEGYPKQRRYPYELKIANAVPEGYQAPTEFRKWLKTNGKIHPNGGGWISNNASVASTVYVGPYAIVRGGTLTGNARVEDWATVEGGTISDNALVRGNAYVYNAKISASAIVEGNGWMEGGSVTGTAIVKGNAMVWGANYANAVVVGGDAEIGDCSTNGVYLQAPFWRNGRTDCDGKGANDVSNIDINSTFSNFPASQMAFTTTPSCGATATYSLSTTIVGSGTVAPASGIFDQASVQTLTATPSAGSIFSGWSGDATGTTNPLLLTMNTNKTVTATFTAIPVTTLTYNVEMSPMSLYDPTTVALDANKIATAFGMTTTQIAGAFGTTIIYAAMNSDGTLNTVSTANAPGHWFDTDGNAVAYGTLALVYSEVNINTLVVSVGQFPDKCTSGEHYTMTQTLQSSNAHVIIIINLTILAKPVIQTITLSKGWNLISTNVHPTDSSVATLFKGLSVLEIKTMDAFWHIGQPAYLNALQSITAGEGYLVNMESAGTLSITGTPVETGHALSLHQGWNLIGCPYQTAMPINATAGSAAGIFGSTFSEIKNFEGFNIPNNAANSIQDCEPGKAYFVK